MLDKISEDKLKLILDKIESYGLVNEDSDTDIINNILNTEEYKEFLKYENIPDDSNVIKKSNILDYFIKSKKYNFK